MADLIVIFNVKYITQVQKYLSKVTVLIKSYELNLFVKAALRCELDI